MIMHSGAIEWSPTPEGTELPIEEPTVLFDAPPHMREAIQEAVSLILRSLLGISQQETEEDLEWRRQVSDAFQWLISCSRRFRNWQTSA
jgi:hypothetical protein